VPGDEDHVPSTRWVTVSVPMFVPSARSQQSGSSSTQRPVHRLGGLADPWRTLPLTSHDCSRTSTASAGRDDPRFQVESGRITVDTGLVLSAITPSSRLQGAG